MTDTPMTVYGLCIHGNIRSRCDRLLLPAKKRCPGGAEIVLRRGRAVRRTRRKGPYGSVEEFMLVVPSRGEYWVEVNDD